MKAIYFEKPNSIEVKERPIPEISDGEALVRVKYIGICGTDVHVFQGHHATAIYPLIPGHEFVGEVAAVKGEDAVNFKLGDKVAAQEIIACGHCDACAKGEPNACEKLRIIGVHTDGGFAEYVRVKTNRMYKLPDDSNLLVASLIEPLAVAVHDIHMSGLKAGQTALIIGGGPIGLLIAMVARYAGARKVVISEVIASRRKFAEELGFITVDPLEDGTDARLNELSEGHGFDVSFEAAGVPSAITTCVDNTRNTGTIVQIAITKGAYPVDLGKVFAKELRIQGVRIHSQYAFAVATRMAVEGSLGKGFEKLISKVFTIDEAKEAFDYAITNKDAFKVIIKVAD